MVLNRVPTPKEILINDSVVKPVWRLPTERFLPPSPQDVLEGNVASLPEPKEFFPQPDELLPRKEEVVEGGKEFVLGITPKPKDIAEAGKELAGLDFDDKIQTFAILAIPPTILVTGLIVVGVLALAGAMK